MAHERAGLNVVSVWEFIVIEIDNALEAVFDFF